MNSATADIKNKTRTKLAIKNELSKSTQHNQHLKHNSVQVKLGLQNDPVTQRTTRTKLEEYKHNTSRLLTQRLLGYNTNINSAASENSKTSKTTQLNHSENHSKNRNTDLETREIRKFIIRQLRGQNSEDNSVATLREIKSKENRKGVVVFARRRRRRRRWVLI